jgi:hypothetical protein
VRALGLARRPGFVRGLRRAGLYVPFRLLYLGFPAHERLRWAELRAFRKGDGALMRRLPPGDRTGPLVLFPLMSNPGLHRLRVEALFAKTLEGRDCRALFVVDRHDIWTEEHLRAFGFEDFVHYDDYIPPRASLEALATAMLEPCKTLDDVVGLTYLEIDVGIHAASRTLGMLRTGTLNPDDPDVLAVLTWALAVSLEAATAFHGIADAFAPDKLVTSVQNLTPWAEFYNGAVLRGIDMLFWFSSQLEEALLFKRYGYEDRYDAYFTLADETWEEVKRRPWSSDDAAAFLTTIRQSYVGGAFARSSALRSGRVKTPDEIRAELGLDPAKKTAVIFVPVLHDAPLWFGKNLFADHTDWLVETVKAAAGNPNLNWVVRVHPELYLLDPGDAKTDDEGVDTMKERVVLQRLFDELPPHIKLMTPESGTNTLSLFDFADYALTVRGTIGLEFPCFGVPTLTAGTGGYSGRGFTIDSDTREQYLERLAHLHEVEPMDEHAVERAQQFSHALFQLKPVHFSTFEAHLLPPDEWDVGWHKHSFTLHVSSPEEFARAEDFGRFADWALDRSRRELFGAAPANAAATASATR